MFLDRWGDLFKSKVTEGKEPKSIERRWLERWFPRKERVYLGSIEGHQFQLIPEGALVIIDGEERFCYRDSKGAWYFEK